MKLTIDELNELLHKEYVRGIEDATKLPKTFTILIKTSK